MRLYQVYNGYTANGPVFVVVIAQKETDAAAMAEIAFRRHRPNMPNTYHTNLEVICLCEDTTQPFVGQVEED